MNDPKPIAILAGISVVIWLQMMLPVTTWGPEQRRLRWLRIQQEEWYRETPPEALLPQLRWLVRQRLTHVLGWAVWFATCAVIGATEGKRRRVLDRHGGYLLVWWTVGILCVAGVYLGVGAYLTLPYGFQPWHTLGALGLLGGLGGYGVMAGRPRVT